MFIGFFRNNIITLDEIMRNRLLHDGSYNYLTQKENIQGSNKRL